MKRRKIGSRELSTNISRPEIRLSTRQKIKSLTKTSKSLQKAFGDTFVDIDTFVEITKREVELIKYEAKIRRNPKAIASLYYLPEAGYTKSVSFSSQDLSHEKTFYFQEDQEIPDSLKFDVLNEELEITHVGSEIIEDFNERFHQKHSSDSSSNIDLGAAKYVINFQNHNFSLLGSAIMERISSLGYYTYNELTALTERYKSHIVNSDNYESLILKLAKRIFRKCKNILFPSTFYYRPLYKIITPKLFYIYPIDEEEKGPMLSWPLLQEAI